MGGTSGGGLAGTAGGGAPHGEAQGTVAGDLAQSPSGSSSAAAASGGAAAHRLSGVDFRGGAGFGGSGSGGGLSGILSHSNNHLFHAMTGTGGGAGAAAAASASSASETQATPPLQRRLAKSFSVAQSSSFQKGLCSISLCLYSQPDLPSTSLFCPWLRLPFAHFSCTWIRFDFVGPFVALLFRWSLHELRFDLASIASVK